MSEFGSLHETERDYLIEHVFNHPIGASLRKSYTADDIAWIGTRQHHVDPKRFLDLLAEIPFGSLDPFEQSFIGWMFVMNDGCWFEGDLDFEWGNAFWNYHETPVIPDEAFELTSISDIIGDTSDDFGEEEEE